MFFRYAYNFYFFITIPTYTQDSWISLECFAKYIQTLNRTSPRFWLASDSFIETSTENPVCALIAKVECHEGCQGWDGRGTWEQWEGYVIPWQIKEKKQL
jgi:hypothetical protein